MMRYFTGPDEEYGLNAQQLHERLALITGSIKGADDAMAAIAEWLDTIRHQASAYVEIAHPALPDPEQTAATEVAGGFVHSLTLEAEALVSDSVYGLITNAKGERVRRRLLSRGDD